MRLNGRVSRKVVSCFFGQVCQSPDVDSVANPVDCLRRFTGGQTDDCARACVCAWSSGRSAPDIIVLIVHRCDTYLSRPPPSIGARCSVAETASRPPASRRSPPRILQLPCRQRRLLRRDRVNEDLTSADCARARANRRRKYFRALRMRARTRDAVSWACYRRRRAAPASPCE